MKKILIVLAVLFAAHTVEAITLQEAAAEAHNWVMSRANVIQNRVEACIAEGDPRLCHTAWAASETPNTAPSDSALATVTLDDPGRRHVDGCGNVCFSGTGRFADAGINIPATAPVNAKLNIAGAGPGIRDEESGTFNWGVQLVIRIKYNGKLYERGYGRGFLESFGWREVETLNP